jgi:hypothetical protein
MLIDSASGVRRSVTGGAFACVGGRGVTRGLGLGFGFGAAFGFVAAGFSVTTTGDELRTTGATLGVDATDRVTGGGVEERAADVVFGAVEVGALFAAGAGAGAGLGVA